MDGYLIFGSAVIKEVVRDIRKGPRGSNRSHFLSAVGFLRSPLFASICEGLGIEPDVAKAKILNQASSKSNSLRRVRNKAGWHPRREWVIVRRQAVNQ